METWEASVSRQKTGRSRIRHISQTSGNTRKESVPSKKLHPLKTVGMQGGDAGTVVEKGVTQPAKAASSPCWKHPHRPFWSLTPGGGAEKQGLCEEPAGYCCRYTCCAARALTHRDNSWGGRVSRMLCKEEHD